MYKGVQPVPDILAPLFLSSFHVIGLSFKEANELHILLRSE